MELRTLEIIEFIKEHYGKFPDQRFGQILFKMDITQFMNKENPESDNFRIRDIYNDIDSEIIDRIRQRRNEIEKSMPGDT